MPRFGKKSKEKLATCDDQLQKVFNEVIKYVDCSILEGHRSGERQENYLKRVKPRYITPMVAIMLVPVGLLMSFLILLIGMIGSVFTYLLASFWG